MQPEGGKKLDLEISDEDVPDAQEAEHKMNEQQLQKKKTKTVIQGYVQEEMPEPEQAV